MSDNRESNQQPDFALGVDVTASHGNIDWRAVASHGLRFAYALATRGDSIHDEQFPRHWPAIAEAKLLRGAIHFYEPLKPARAQADHFVRTVGKPGNSDLPAALWLSNARTLTGLEQWDGVRRSERINRILEWLQVVEQALGSKPVLFVQPTFLRDQIADPHDLAGYPLWLIDKTRAPHPALPHGWHSWTLWRYADAVKIHGVETAVALSRFNGSAEKLASLVKAGQLGHVQTASAPILTPAVAENAEAESKESAAEETEKGNTETIADSVPVSPEKIVRRPKRGE